jgi:hypothetical protein
VIEFPFPLPFNKFIEGVPLAPQAFMATWQKVQPENGLERQDVVTPSAGIVLETIEEKILGLGKRLTPVCPTNCRPISLACLHAGARPVMCRDE